MRKNKLLLLLALLLTAATGAWAEEKMVTINSGTMSSGAVTATGFGKIGDILYVGQDPVTITTSEGVITKLVIKKGVTYVQAFTEANVGVTPGTITYGSDEITVTDINAESVTLSRKGDNNWSPSSIDVYYAAPAGYTVSMKSGVKDAGKWTVKVGEGQAQALPIGGLKGDGSETVTLQYNGRLKVKGVKATSDAAPAAGKTVDLSTLTADYEAQNGDVLTNATTTYKVTIAAGATVTLDGVSISSSGGYYCIKCLGDATIILKDGSTNTLTSTSTEYPALSIGDANTTLTIQGSTGVLNVTSGEYCAGIGGGYMNANKTCGNIRIEGGVITAQGGRSGAGIGTDCGEATCGDIIITGGTITAKGGGKAAGIGTGNGESVQAVCGDITIASTVTKVTATKGENAAHSIGKGYGSKASCGTVTIGGNTGAISESPYTYDPSAPASLIVNPVVGQIIGSDGKNYDANATLPTGVTAVAKIFYVGSETGEDAPYNHGLALALSDANGGNTCTWKTSNTDAGHTKQTSSTFTEESGLQYNAMHNSEIDNYPAFKAAMANNSTAAPTGCSAWFLASGYQWTKMIAGAGGANALKSLAGLTNTYYWTSSEINAGKAWRYEFNTTPRFYNVFKNQSESWVRPCLAF